ncbi:MAG: guanylate kinase [Deltaproteobacteria bacterium]|nr:guanylate kinase [Deltaproteobacteria bacterium]
MMAVRRGRLFIISAPSGAGKTTLCRATLKRLKDMLYSVSYTTRSPRKGEQDGVDYHFISKEGFRADIKTGRWSEWAEVHGNYYGTSAEFIEKGLSSGRDTLLDIDVQGTIQILKRHPDSVTIFVLPPSMDTLRQRLEMRGTESETVLKRRLENAKKEMTQQNLYRHLIVNDQLSSAIEELISIIQGYRL